MVKGGQLYNAVDGSTITVPDLFLENPVEYPKDWFIKNESKPKVNVTRNKNGTLEFSRNAMFHLIQGTLVTPKEVVEYLWRVFKTIKETSTEVWKSYDQEIAVGDVTPLSLLNVQETEVESKLPKLSQQSHNGDNDDMYILVMLSGLYRFALCPEQQKEAISNKVEAIALAYRPDDNCPITLTTSHANANLIKDNTEVKILLSALDMFLEKFPSNSYNKVRVGTIVLRYAGCSALADVTYFSMLISTEALVDAITWFFIPSLMKEVAQLLGQNPSDELQIKHSYFPYSLGMNLTTKSPYSANNNPNIHLLIHGIGSLFHSPRSLNARSLNDTNAVGVAVNIAIVYIAKRGYAKISAGDRAEKHKRIKAGQEKRQDAAKSDPIQVLTSKTRKLKHPDEWVAYYSSRDCIFTKDDHKAIQRAVSSIVEARDGTVGMWMRDTFITLLKFEE